MWWSSHVLQERIQLPFVVNEGLKLTKMPLLGKPGKRPLKVVGNKCFGRLNP
ncbi:hypothetical protein Hanom_Chr00s072508g01789431 [Helianthus anomalus]